MKFVNQCMAVFLSFVVFMMVYTPCGFAAEKNQGSKIEIRMTKEVPIPKVQDTSATQWFKDHKWMILLGTALAGGAAAAAGGGGGDGNPEQEKGEVTIHWNTR